MTFTLTEEQTLLRDSARDFFREQAPVTRFRKMRDEKRRRTAAILNCGPRSRRLVSPACSCRKSMAVRGLVMSAWAWCLKLQVARSCPRRCIRPP
jgi:hypothetical protein